MSKTLVSFILCCLCVLSLHAQRDPKLSLDPSKAEWFCEAKFGMFIHWGLYSVLEGSHKGHTMPDKSFKNGNSWYAEWIQMRLERRICYNAPAHHGHQRQGQLPGAGNRTACHLRQPW